MSNTSTYTTQLKFAQALKIVRAIPPHSSLQPIAADRLRFYGLYKQATEGDVNIPRPSTRKVVEYAKWKSWSRMKGLSPLEAQKLYVDSLNQLLIEFIQRYPNHEQIEFIKKSYHSLQLDNEEYEIEDNDDELSEFELEKHFLNDFEAEQLLREGIISPPGSQASSFIQYPSRYQEQRKTSIDTQDYPTPITSPGQNTITGQWVVNQLQQHNRNYVHPIDFLQYQKTNDSFSEATSYKKSSYNNNNMDSSSSGESQSKKKNKSSDRAIENLQTEVTALTEQVDRLRYSLQLKEERKVNWIKGIVKILIRHILADSAILLILFYILWRKRSPVAYAILGHITPIIQEMLRKLLNKIVFWKVTV